MFERYAEQARRSAASTGADNTVTEVGDHRELIRAGGLYAELYRLQAEAYGATTGPRGGAR